MRLGIPEGPDSHLTFELDKAYGSAGSYGTVVHVSDGIANISSNIIMMDVAPFSLTIDLVAGWNLVTVPLVDHRYRASTFPGLALGDAVFGYDSSAKAYVESFVVGISPPTSDFDIVEGRGYWVYSSEAKPAELIGGVPGGIRTIVIESEGWAIVGLTSLKTWHASNILEMCTEGHVDAVVGFDPASQTYKMYAQGLPFTDFLIPPGRASWIYCGAGTVLTYAA